MALGALGEWNARNEPPLCAAELEGVTASAYKGQMQDGGGVVGRVGDRVVQIDPTICYTPADVMARGADPVEFYVSGLHSLAIGGPG